MLKALPSQQQQQQQQQLHDSIMEHQPQEQLVVERQGQHAHEQQQEEGDNNVDSFSGGDQHPTSEQDELAQALEDQIETTNKAESGKASSCYLAVNATLHILRYFGKSAKASTGSVSIAPF